MSAQRVDDLWRDLRYALRSFAAAPGFTVAAVLTLALGIGSVAIIYSVLNNVLLDPLPYPDSHRFVNVLVRDLETGRARQGLSASEFVDLRDRSTVFDGAIGTIGDVAFYDTGEAVEPLRAVRVTPNFFQFMGLPPLIGRTAGEEDGRADAPPVVVLRHRAWVTYFNADPSVVGRTIRLSGRQMTVVGVMPPRFTWHGADVWIPEAVTSPAPGAAPAFRALQARIRPGVSLHEAGEQLTAIAAARAREFPKEYPPKFRVEVVNVIDFTVGGFSRVLYTTLAAVGLLMAIACCNVTNMLLARATTRQREMTVRAALGAGTGRIVRQLLIEGVVLAVGGAAAGCLFAYAGLDALVSVLPPSPLPGEIEIALDGPTLAVSLAVAMAAAVMFGLAPAWYGRRRDLVEGLKTAGKGVADSRGGLRNALVTAEIALSIVLLLAAGLLVRSFASLVRVDVGFDPRPIVMASVSFPPGTYTDAGGRHRFYAAAVERIAALPGVDAAAVSSMTPPFGGASARLEVPGQPPRQDATVALQLCSEDYFRTMGIALLRGRGLADVPAGASAQTAVVSQRLAQEYFTGEDPIGKRIALSPSIGSLQPSLHGPFEIVGVAADVSNRGLRDASVPHVYLPATAGSTSMVLLARASAPPSSLVNAIRREIGAVDRGVAVRQPTALTEMLHRFVYAEPRFSLIVLGAFAATATLLVAVGIFGVMAYTVSRQTREIAVRMALGARRGQVFGMVLRLATRLLAAGVALGLVASFASSRLLANQLWNTSPYDPVAFAGALAIIVAVALLACYVPARRAMNVEPMTALRNE
jgi:putative ABC transport system permease protein